MVLKKNRRLFCLECTIILNSLIAHSWVMIKKPIRSGNLFYYLIHVRGPRFLLIYQVSDYFDYFVRISIKRLIDWLINDCFDCDVYVATHLEKSTHFEKKDSKCVKTWNQMTTLWSFFQSTLNWGPTQSTLKTIFYVYKDSLFTQKDRITKLEYWTFWLSIEL